MDRIWVVFDSHIRCHSPENVNHKNQTDSEKLLITIGSHLAALHAGVNQKTRPLFAQELALEVGSRSLRTQVGVVGGHLFWLFLTFGEYCLLSCKAPEKAGRPGQI